MNMDQGEHALLSATLHSLFVNSSKSKAENAWGWSERNALSDSLSQAALPPGLEEGRRGEGDLWERALRGGYTEIVSGNTPKRRRAWFGAYVMTVLQRDIRDLANVDGLTAMPRLPAFLERTFLVQALSTRPSNRWLSRLNP